MTATDKEIRDAIEALQRRWGFTWHTAVHVLRLVGQGGRFTTTSGRRSTKQNTAVGGAPRSYHLRGRAVDYVPPRARWRRFLKLTHDDRCGLECRGPVEVLDEGDHIHAAW